jgi:membrane-associated protease RseP (regulator of RpoE activity)
VRARARLGGRATGRRRVGAADPAGHRVGPGRQQTLAAALGTAATTERAGLVVGAVVGAVVGLVVGVVVGPVDPVGALVGRATEVTIRCSMPAHGDRD